MTCPLRAPPAVTATDENKKAGSPGTNQRSFLDMLREDSFEKVGDILQSEAQVNSIPREITKQATP